MAFKTIFQRVAAVICHRSTGPAEEMRGISAKVRAKQIQSVLETTPLMLVVNMLNSAITLGFLHTSPVGGFLICWTAAIWTASLIGLADWFFRQRHMVIRRASERALRRVAFHATVLGGLWGLLAAVAYPHADFGGKLLITAVASGMAGGGCLVLYVVPLAMAGWLATFVTGMVTGLALSGQSSDYATLMLCVLYAISLFRAGITASRTFNQNSVAAEMIKDQSATIQMLLSDFSEGSRDWLWETGRDGRLVRGEKQLFENAGLPFAGDGRGALRLWTQGAGNAVAVATLRDAYQHREPFRNILLESNGPAGNHWIRISGKPIFDEENRFAGFRGVASNVTDIHVAEKRIAYLAYHDPLTGLTNRPSFTAAMERAFAKRLTEEAAVFYLDLDGFKQVNDQYGHAMGDKLLAEVARRLLAIIPAGNDVARLGGDEFAAIISSLERGPRMEALLGDVIEGISRPYLIAGAELRISVSIGVAMAERDLQGQADWLNRADLALYRAKEEGKAGYRFYEEAMDDIVQRQLRLERDLRQFAENGSLSVVFQPYVRASGRRTAGFEALARWDHPELGPVSPLEFIPIAERAGLIEEIGTQVLEQAVRAAASWPDHVRVAVNLSPQQIHRSDIAERVFDILERAGMDPRRLELEITETSFLTEDELVLDNLRKLKAEGISIALDDFGTGYSALSYLLRFPFDKLKIDKSFVMPALSGHAARDMLETIHNLAQALKINITAEGVENEGQAGLLEGMGCHFLQGYHFSRPITSDRIAAYLLREESSRLSDPERAAGAALTDASRGEASG